MTYKHSNATFSQFLSEGENQLLQHIGRWGSDAYPVIKRGGKWWVGDMFGVSGCPVPFKTKTQAVAQFELQVSLLRDRFAGRI